MKTFIRILTFAKPHWLKVIIAFISSIFYSVFNAMSLWIVSSLIGTIMVSKNIQNKREIDLDGVFDKINQSINDIGVKIDIEGDEYNILNVICIELIDYYIILYIILHRACNILCIISIILD